MIRYIALKKIGSKVLSFEAGWLLDVYLKDASAFWKHPLATFQFQPQIKTAKPESTNAPRRTGSYMSGPRAYH